MKVISFLKGVSPGNGRETSVMLPSYYFFVVRLRVVLHATFEDFCHKRYKDILSQIRTMANTIQFVKQEHRINDPNKYFFFYNN